MNEARHKVLVDGCGRVAAWRDVRVRAAMLRREAELRREVADIQALSVVRHILFPMAVGAVAYLAIRVVGLFF